MRSNVPRPTDGHPPRGRLPLLLSFLMVSALLAGGLLWWMRSGSDPLASFDAYPQTYIRVEDAGYDEARVIIVRARNQDPVIHTENGDAYPAYLHPDPQVVPMKDGKPYIFPLMPTSSFARTTPALPPSGRPLDKAQLDRVRPYRTPEGQAIVDRFLAGTAP